MKAYLIQTVLFGKSNRTIKTCFKCEYKNNFGTLYYRPKILMFSYSFLKITLKATTNEMN